MDFLIPQFLWLIPISSVPLIIHLLNRSRKNRVDFGSIQFLNIIKDKSIQRLSIINILLLILRTLIILLLIIAASRPTLNSNYILGIDSSNSDLSLIYFDNTLSSKGIRNGEDVISLYEKYYRDIIKSINRTSKVYIGTGTNRILTSGYKEDMFDIKLPDLNKMGTNNLEGFIYDAINDDISQYLNKEIHIISDGDMKILESVINNKDLSDFNIYLYILPEMLNNIALKNLSIENIAIKPNIPFKIRVEVDNTTIVESDNILVQLFLNDAMVGQKYFDLGPNKTKDIEFVTTIPSQGIHKGYITINRDDRVEDNKIYFCIQIPNNILFDIHYSDKNDLIFFESAINAIIDNDSNIDINRFGKDSEIELNRSSDVSFIFGFEALSSVRDLIDYRNYRMRKFIFFPSSLDSVVPSDLLTNKIFTKSDRLVASLDESFFPISFNNLNIFSDRFDSNQDEIELYKFFPLESSSSSVIRAGQHSIWNRYMTPYGTEEYFAFALNRSWTNLPMKGMFIPFIYYLVFDGVSNINRNYSITEPSISFNVPIEGSKFTLSNDFGIIMNSTSYEDNIVYFDTPRDKGIYSANLINQQLFFSINHDYNDIKLDIIDKRVIDNKNIFIVDTQSIEKSIESARIGSELWKIILIIIFILIAFEMILSNRSRV